MSTGFDPYHRWLSIPSSDQPPTHYRILGLPPFERDLQVIENAALRQIAHVRSFLETPMRAYAVNLIHELSVARQCLVKSESKAAYDAWLRQLTPTPSVANSTSRPHFAESAAPTTALQASVRRRSASEVREKPTPTTAQRGVSSPNDWIDAPPVGDGPENYWPREQPHAAPDFDFQPRLSIKRRRKKSPLATLFSIVMWGIGTAAGILAGYAILCIVDTKYDYLNLFSTVKPEASVTPKVELRDAPSNPQPKAPLQLPHKPKQQAIPKLQPGPANGNNNLGANIAPNNGNLNLPAGSKPKPIDTNPLDSLPIHISLPALDVVAPPSALAAFPPGSDATPIDLSLIDGGDQEKGKLELRESPSELPSKRWMARWTPAATDLAKINEIDPKDIGTVLLNVDGLTYGWTADAPKQAASSLRNSLLRIASGDKEHFIALRDPVDSRPLTIDLKAPRVHTMCKCEDPPQPSDVRVDITALDGFPPYRLEGSELTGLKVGDKATLQYTGVQRAATQLSIVRSGALVSIQVESRYQLPSNDEEGMSIMLGNRKLKQLNQRLDNAHRANDELPRLRAYLDSTLPAKLRAIQNASTGAYLPNGAYVESPQLAMEKRKRIAEINTDANNTRKQIDDDANLVAQLPEIEADIAELNKVAELAEAIQGKAVIAFRFYRLIGEHQIDLSVSN
jgi:hypothetical protein